MSVTVVLLPGYMNAYAGEWLTFIEEKYKNVVRVQQTDWLKPSRLEWVEKLQETLETIDGDIILVGHSCGALTIGQWDELYKNRRIIGALLVAPADVDRQNVLLEIINMRPLPKNKLSFPSILVSSDNDEHISLSKATELATCWGCELVVMPNAGHIHALTGFGEWHQGDALIQTFHQNALVLK